MIGHELPSPRAALEFLYAFHGEEKIAEAQQRRLPEQIAYIPDETPALEGLGRVNRDLVQHFGEMPFRRGSKGHTPPPGSSAADLFIPPLMPLPPPLAVAANVPGCKPLPKRCTATRQLHGPQHADHSHPTETLIHPHMHLLANSIASVTLGGSVNGTGPVCVGLGRMKGNVYTPQLLHEAPRFVVFVHAKLHSSNGRNPLARISIIDS